MKREVVRLGFATVDACPLCGGSGEPAGTLVMDMYRFGRVDIPITTESGRIRVQRCWRCSLVYKGEVPEREGLARVFERAGEAVWKTRPDSHARERTLLEGHAPSIPFDILDIGASDGGLLRAVADLTHRRSALDVVPYAECRRWVTGEYILGFAEDGFSWSGEPYAVVTAYDVIEHLYNPASALDRFAELVAPGGILVIETGNADACPPQNLGSWWYLNLFEHHVVWPETTLRQALAGRGFEIVCIRAAQHKARYYMPAHKRAAFEVLHRLRRIRPVRAAVLKGLGMDLRLLGQPRIKDHMTVVAKRSS